MGLIVFYSRWNLPEVGFPSEFLWTSDRKTSYEKAILIKYVGEVILKLIKN